MNWIKKPFILVGILLLLLIILPVLAYGSIVTDDGKYNSHGDIAMMKNGDLIMVYRKATAHNGVPSTVVIKISSDNGSTWGSETVIWSPVWGLNAAQVGISVTDNGSVIVTVGTMAAGNLMPDGIYLIQSNNNGVTWGNARQITEAGFNKYSISKAGIVELDNGNWLLPYEGKSLPGWDTYSSAARLKSVDGGINWWAGDVIIADGDIAGIDFGEVALANLGGTNVFALIRTSTDYFYGSWSSNSGDTWSTPEPVFKGTGTAPSVARLPDGSLITIYRDFSASHKTVYRVSADNGHNWYDAVALDGEDFPNMSGGAVGVLSGDNMTTHIAYFVETNILDPYASVCQARFTSISGVFNGNVYIDNKIDNKDFITLIWDNLQGNLRSDFNKDGKVDIKDFGIMADNWEFSY